MKRVGYLITKEKVTLDLCKDAIMKASRHKRSRKSVKVVIDNLDYYALELRNMVLYDLYEPAEYGHAVKIEHGKERYLSKPKFFPDQCIHNLIFMLGEKQFYNHIDPHSISSIPGRGIRYGHKLLKRWIQTSSLSKVKSMKYCLKYDIKKCFESIKPKYIMRELRTIFKDEKYLNLIEKTLSKSDSLPIGNYLSAWLMNILLRRVDMQIRNDKHVSHYLRYMDDSVIFSNNKSALRDLFKRIQILLDQIDLQVKEDWQIFRVLDYVQVNPESGRTNGSKQSVKFIQNHPNKKFRIYYGKGVSYYKIFTYRAVDMLGMKYSNTGIGWRKKNLKKLKRECLAFHLKHKHFTNRRAMRLLSLISYKHLYSSDKVWKFVTSHVNISQLKYIAYGDDYLERRIRKAKHRKGEYSSFPHKIMYSVEFKLKKENENDETVTIKKLVHTKEEIKQTVYDTMNNNMETYEVYKKQNKHNWKYVNRCKRKYYDREYNKQMDVIKRRGMVGSPLQERVSYYKDKRDEYIDKMKEKYSLKRKEDLAHNTFDPAFLKIIPGGNK